MAESTGKTGRGVSFQISDGESPPGWITVANATTMSPSGRDAEEIDFTHLGSTGGFREFRQGFKDPGSIGIDYHLDPTNSTHQEVLALWLSGDLFEWRINFTDAGWAYALVGNGFMKNPGDITVDVSNPISASSTVRVTGETQFQPV